MIPLFKSHCSIGKSILKISEIFDLALKNNFKKVYLIEDSLISFLDSHKHAKENDLQLIFGLRLKVSHDSQNPSSVHKIIVFAKDDLGCRLINKIYSKAFSDPSGVISNKDLKSLWENKHLVLAVPFYDSFIFMNSLHFNNCIPDFSFTSPYFFLENNLLPFDSNIQDKVKKYCKDNNCKTVLTKSIFYEKRIDFNAYQTYKCICNRRFDKQRTLNVPNFDHLGSFEFCLESFLENELS